MANRSHTLYVGVTNDISRRVWEHKHMLTEGFTSRYRMDKLVYYEAVPDATAAILREKNIKGWVRRRRVALIESVNPDLSRDFLDIRPVPAGVSNVARHRRSRDSSLLATKARSGPRKIGRSSAGDWR